MNYRIYWYCIALFLAMMSSWSWSVPESEENTNYYIVFEKSPALLYQKDLSGGSLLGTSLFKAKREAARRYSRTLKADQNQTIERLRLMDPTSRVRTRFTDLINAISVEMSEEMRSEVNSWPGVAYVSKVGKVWPTLTASNELAAFPQAWQQMGGEEMAGEGVLIAIIDTGIDITHPAFRDEGYLYPEGFPKGEVEFTSKKIIVSRVFPPENGVQGDVTPFDRSGHGSNVASIAAANAGVYSPLGFLSGAAPRAYLGNYKVFTSGGAENDQVISAMEAAVLDGADVINLSLGMKLFGDPNYDPQIVALRNAVDVGSVVVIATGNEGKEFRIGNPNQAPEAITVGAITNRHAKDFDEDKFEVKYYLDMNVYIENELALENEEVHFGLGGVAFRVPHIGTFPVQDVDLIDGGGFGGENDGLLCQDVSLPQLEEEWLLVRRGDCLFMDKIERAEEAGAKGVIFVDYKEEFTDHPSVEGSTLPSLMISKENGEVIKEALRDGLDVKVQFQGQERNSRQSTPSQITSFSGHGPSADYLLKPELVGIGSQVFGGTQNDDSTQGDFIAAGFEWFSGTSMSTPQVAGAAALLRQLHPDWPPAWIKSALMLSANREVYQSSSSQRAPIVQRGAGMVDSTKALQVDTLAFPAMINLRKQMLFQREEITRRLEIRNVSEEKNEYTLKKSVEDGSLVVDIPYPMFTLEAGESMKMNLRFTLPAGLSDGDYDSDLLLVNETKGQTYRIPYWVRVQRVVDPNANVLLIDDDHGESWEEVYEESLRRIGKSYVTWEVESLGTYPVLNYLSQFNTVLWVMSEKSLNAIREIDQEGFIREEYAKAFNTRHLFEMEMMKYLNQGGSLFLSGQDYFDDKEEAPFSQEVLGVNMRERDAGANQIQGVAGNPAFGDVSVIRMEFPVDYENYPDIIDPVVGRGIAQRAFYADGRRTKTVGVTVENCNYRAVFLAFPLEVFVEEEEIDLVLRKGLQWLQAPGSFEKTELGQMTPDTIKLSEFNEVQTVRIEGEGFSFAEGYRVKLGDYGLEDVERESCQRLRADLSMEMKAGVYDLEVEMGDGQRFVLDEALTIVDDTQVEEWSMF